VHLDDEELVARAKAGDGNAFAQLYERYFDKVYRYAAYRVGAKEVAEDITSQVFLRALESLHSYRWQGLPFSAWLFRIARNLLVDRLRREKRRPAVPLEEDLIADSLDVEDQADQNMKLEEVRRALSLITEAQRQAIVLRLVAGLSLGETAKAMGRSLGAVKALQHGGLRALRRHLEIREAPTG